MPIRWWQPCAMLVVAALILAGCARGGGPSDPGESAPGTLSGEITRGPMFPVSGPGAPSPATAPVAGAELRIVDSNGALVATARTGADGRYQVSLPAGEYRLERGAGFSGATKNLPAKIAISPGGHTRFDVLVDTGIR
ncbi:MAG TPA: carboxypeptidase-like regulatory domain-containing protein [Candidatus Binataceae bacterium]|nr:carboxypeptidase-like regulatory domain-containing protein [Candidatus Binataceae bacterium]